MITGKTKDLKDIDFAEGAAILLDKPLGWTSFRMVHKVRQLIDVKKVGHAGTLDPKATGLLILCTGRKTKEIDKYQGLDKEYTGSFCLGARTESMDSESEIIETGSIENITEDLLKKTAEEFTGDLKQKPPMFSAVKYKGEKLYVLARKGKTVVRGPRDITVYEFDITDIKLPEVFFRIRCSRGTYIRVIADDFGNRLGCGAYLSSLKRTAIGEYRIEDALQFEEFAALTSGET